MAKYLIYSLVNLIYADESKAEDQFRLDWMAKLIQEQKVDADKSTDEQWAQYSGSLKAEQSLHANDQNYKSEYTKQLPGFKELVIGACFADKGLQSRDLEEGAEFYDDWLQT